jgi:hypothetical protein
MGTCMARSLEWRIHFLEERVRQLMPRKFFSRGEAEAEQEIVERYFQRLEQCMHEREARDARPVSERITLKKRDLEDLDAEIARAEKPPASSRGIGLLRLGPRDPDAVPLLRFCRRCVEIELLELQEQISLEAAWVAREQATQSVRTGRAQRPIPSYEQALEIIASGQVGCAFQPAELRNKTPSGNPRVVGDDKLQRPRGTLPLP